MNPFLQSSKETSSPTVGIRIVIWEGHGSPATEEILRNLPNTNVHYGVHKIPSFVSIQNNINLAHNLPINLYKMYFNIILPFTSSTSKWYSFQVPPTKTQYASLSFHKPYVFSRNHFHSFYHLTLFGELLQLKTLKVFEYLHMIYEYDGRQKYFRRSVYSFTTNACRFCILLSKTDTNRYFPLSLQRCKSFGI